MVERARGTARRTINRSVVKFDNENSVTVDISAQTLTSEIQKVCNRTHSPAGRVGGADYLRPFGELPFGGLCESPPALPAALSAGQTRAAGRQPAMPVCGGVGKSFLGYERVYEPAAERLGRAFQTLYGDVPGRLAALKFDDAGLVHTEPLCELARRHAWRNVYRVARMLRPYDKIYLILAPIFNKKCLIDI